MSKKPSVFISHSSKDKPFVRQLGEALKKYGVDVWLDEYEMHAGDSLFDYISRGIEKAEYFAIVLSNNSIDSKWVRNELKAALNRELEEDRTFVIPILIEDVEAPTFLKEKIYSDFRSIEQFESSLTNLLKVFGVQTRHRFGEKDKKAELYPEPFLPDLRFFVGRILLLKTIRETLKKDHRAVIHDISGLGKTFTSYKFASDNHPGYEKIFLVRATKEEWLESLAKCGESVDPTLANLTEQAAKANGFKKWLEENDNWLVIYDNVDLPEELSFFVPANFGGDCLFTSNSSDAAFLGTEIRIEKMDPNAAGILLYSRALGKPLQMPELDGEEKSAFDHLVTEIDGLPVTLNSTGAVIFKRKLNFRRFREIYGRTPEVAWESEDPYSPYQRKSAGKIFSFVYDELCGDEKTGNAVKIILDSMSFISPDEIPEDLLQKILREQDESFAQMVDPNDLWDDVREKITAYDLLKYNRQKKIFTTHRAIQRVIQSRLKGEEKDVCIALASVLRGLFPMYDYSNREECEKYYQHVIVLLENADKFIAEIGAANNLYFKVGCYQRRLGNYKFAEKFHFRASEISTAVFGAESTTQARDLNELALDYKLQGRYDEAIEKYEEALRIDEKTIGREHPDYAVHLNNLANVYSDQGRCDEAIEKFEEVLKIIGRDHPSYAFCLNNVAVVYSHQARYKDAIEKYEEALRIDEQTIGREHPDYAVHLNNLANVYEKQGKFQEALGLFKDALRIFEKTLPEGHPHSALLRESVERCGKLVH